MQNSQPQQDTSARSRLNNFIKFEFFKTVNFWIKLIIIILGIAGAIAVGWRYETLSPTRFYHFVVVTSIIIQLGLIAIYLLNLMAKFNKVPWVIVQIIIDVVYILFYIIAASVCVDYVRKYLYFESYGAAAFFGFALVLLHILEAIFYFIHWKRGTFYFTQTTTQTDQTTGAGGQTIVTTKTTVVKQSTNNQIVY